MLHSRSVPFVAALLTATIALCGSSAPMQETQQVTLQNGVTYSIPTQNGMPIPFRSPHVEFSGLGPTYMTESRQFHFVAQFQLKAEGKYRVTVNSALNRNLRASFECTGPGDVTQFFFNRAQYPSIWMWIYDDEPTWIPFAFTFESIPLGTTFTASQWIKLNTGAKQEFRQYWKK
jgi:hypothetical protein